MEDAKVVQTMMLDEVDSQNRILKQIDNQMEVSLPDVAIVYALIFHITF